MNPFELAKKLDEYKKLVDEFAHLDTNHNHTPDAIELLGHLKELRDLLVAEEGKIGADLEHARTSVEAKVREIAKLADDDVEAIRAKLKV